MFLSDTHAAQTLHSPDWIKTQPVGKHKYIHTDNVTRKASYANIEYNMYTFDTLLYSVYIIHNMYTLDIPLITFCIHHHI